MPAATIAQDEVTPGGTLVVAADTEPVNLNPAMVASNGVFYVSSKVVEPLAEMDSGGTLRPLLATSWEGSKDGSTFTVNLREGVTWHDGEPFTSADVAFSAMEVWKAHDIRAETATFDERGVPGRTLVGDDGKGRVDGAGHAEERANSWPARCRRRPAE